MQQLKNLKVEGVKIKNEVRDRTMMYVLGGLGIVVGLAWNEAIKGLIEHVFPFAGGGSLLAKFLYAIILTLVVVLVTMYIFRTPDERK